MENASLFCHYYTVPHSWSPNNREKWAKNQSASTAARPRNKRIFAQQPNRPTTRTVSVRHPAVTCNWDKVATQSRGCQPAGCSSATPMQNSTSTSPCSHRRHFLKTPTATAIPPAADRHLGRLYYGVAFR